MNTPSFQISGVKRNGVWQSIKAERHGVKVDMEGVISLKAYIHMIPNFLKNQVTLKGGL